MILSCANTEQKVKLYEIAARMKQYGMVPDAFIVPQQEETLGLGLG